MVGRTGGYLNDLPAQPPHQRGILAHWIDDQNSVLGDGEEHV